MLCGQIQINEVLAKNASVNVDNFGEYDDWVELHNFSGEPALLENYYLSDDAENLQKWAFPAYEISADEHLLIWCDEDGSQGEFHSNFKLSSSGECVYLTKEDQLIDHVCFSQQQKNVSYGRNPNADEWLYFSAPTAAYSNISGGKNTLAERPESSHQQGHYSDGFLLELSSSDSNVNIHYELGGKEPTAFSPIYQEPLSINKNTVVRFFSKGENIVDSEIESRTFILDKEASIPSIFIAMNPADLFSSNQGIYADGNFFFLWERATHISLLELDGQTAFALDAGISISGGSTRYYPQKSFNINTRSIYGNGTIDYPLFPDSEISEYDGFRLRIGGNDNESTLIRDGLMQGIMDNSFLETQNHRPVAVYLNGEYWGIYNIREKHNEEYFKNKTGKEVRDLINQNGKAGIGDTLFYGETKRFFREHHFHETALYDSAASLIDIDNFMDYYIAQIYFANSDWLDNNTKVWRTDNGKWRWLIFDTDLGFGFAPRWGHPGGVEHQTLTWAMNCCDAPDLHNSPKSTIFFRRLLENENFRMAFLKRFNYHLNHTFCTDRILALIDDMSKEIALEMPYHLERWDEIQDVEEWEANLEHMRQFALVRPREISAQIIEYFELEGYEEIALFAENHDQGTVQLNWDYPFESSSCSQQLFYPQEINIEALPNEDAGFISWYNLNENSSSINEIWDGQTTYTAQFSNEEQPSSTSDFSLFPNPMQESIFVKWASDKSDPYQLNIYNQWGAQVFTKSGETFAWNLEKITLQYLPAGIYFLKIDIGNESRKNSFLKQ